MRDTAKEAFKRTAHSAPKPRPADAGRRGHPRDLTIQLLKALEEQAGAPCYRIFDLFAGTSTGGIISGLVASGKTALEIEALYEKLVSKVFQRRDLFANQFVNPPAWSKASYRRLLKELLGDVSLQAACDGTGIDLLLTAHDVAEGEETFFSYLHERPAEKNRYGGVLLRAAMEATMSAPTYFNPLERFVDGGTTTYNNPTLAAVLEAVQYGPGTYSERQAVRVLVRHRVPHAAHRARAGSEPTRPGYAVLARLADDRIRQRRLRHAERSLPRHGACSADATTGASRSRSTRPPSRSCPTSGSRPCTPPMPSRSTS